jgi:choline transport protein
MAEEIHDAPRVVPFSIWSSFIFNGALGFAMLVAVLFCIQDVEAATESETGFPIIDIFVNVLGSVKGGSAMVTHPHDTIGDVHC